MCYFFHCYFAVCFGVHLIYYTYARNDRFRHADGFSFSFVLIQKKRKRKEKIKATSPGLLRKGRSGTEKWTRFVALRSDSIFQRRPAIPTLTPIRLGQSFFHAKALRCWLFISALPCLRLLLFSSVYFYVYSMKYLSISHWKFCLLARNSRMIFYIFMLDI